MKRDSRNRRRLLQIAEATPLFPGVCFSALDTTRALAAGAIARAMDELRKLDPNAGSYVAESDFFEPNWQESYWGTNYSKLLAVKSKYDPDGLFVVHHGVGCERWSDDGFAKLV